MYCMQSIPWQIVFPLGVWSPRLFRNKLDFKDPSSKFDPVDLVFSLEKEAQSCLTSPFSDHKMAQAKFWQILDG